MTSKMKSAAKICGLVLGSIFAIICFIGLGFGLMILDSKAQQNYYKSANWNCDTKEEFLSVYKPLYEEKIDSFVKEEFCFEKLIETNEKSGEFNIYYYNDTTTIVFEFFQTTVGFAHFKVYCYCYATNEMNLQAFEEQKQYIDFINQVINFCAFDVRGDENTFKNLFDESIASSENYASNYYHFDDYCGNIGYGVAVKRNNRYDGYYYKMGKKELVMEANIFLFEGILKQQLSV